LLWGRGAYDLYNAKMQKYAYKFLIPHGRLLPQQPAIPTSPSPPRPPIIMSPSVRSAAIATDRAFGGAVGWSQRAGFWSVSNSQSVTNFRPSQSPTLQPHQPTSPKWPPTPPDILLPTHSCDHNPWSNWSCARHPRLQGRISGSAKEAAGRGTGKGHEGIPRATVEEGSEGVFWGDKIKVLTRPQTRKSPLGV